MAFPTNIAAPLVPARGLLHPAWLACLAALALNDHVLKGAGVLPAVVTGKLSDFAGLFVAPLLLALVLRVRSERGWALSHVAVGVVFAAIQLSAPLASAWSALMAGVGFPWVITRDWTDLFALPALVASALHLRPALQRPAARALRATAETAAAGVGLLACVATSSPEPDPEEPPEAFPEEPEGDTGWQNEPAPLADLFTDVYVHNGLPLDLIVRIRPLADAVDLDCAAIEAAPGSLLTSPLFGLAQSWTLPAGTNQAVLPGGDGRECRAALLEVDGLAPQIVFWRAGTPPQHQVPGAGSMPEDEGEIAVIPDPDGGMMWRGGAAISHDVTSMSVECAPQPDGTRLAWSEPVPWGRYELLSLEPGADGCWALQLHADGLGDETWFLCVPTETMVLQAGDVIDIALPSLEAALPGSFQGIEIAVVDEAEPPVGRRLLVSTGESVPRVPGLELALVPHFECDPEVQPVCGTVARPLHLSVAAEGLGAAALTPDGTPVTLAGEGRRLDLALLHGQERFALDPGCAMGPDLLGSDLELVVAEQPDPGA